jgi:chromate transporter
MLATRVWHRYRNASWRDRAERGLAPVAIGLIFASVITLIQDSRQSLPAYALTGVATLVLTLNPMWLLGIGAMIGGLLHF